MRIVGKSFSRFGVAGALILLQFIGTIKAAPPSRSQIDATIRKLYEETSIEKARHRASDMLQNEIRVVKSDSASEYAKFVSMTKVYMIAENVLVVERELNGGQVSDELLAMVQQIPSALEDSLDEHIHVANQKSDEKWKRLVAVLTAARQDALLAEMRTLRDLGKQKKLQELVLAHADFILEQDIPLTTLFPKKNELKHSRPDPEAQEKGDHALKLNGDGLQILELIWKWESALCNESKESLEECMVKGPHKKTATAILRELDRERRTEGDFDKLLRFEWDERSSFKLVRNAEGYTAICGKRLLHYEVDGTQRALRESQRFKVVRQDNRFLLDLGPGKK